MKVEGCRVQIEGFRVHDAGFSGHGGKVVCEFPFSSVARYQADGAMEFAGTNWTRKRCFAVVIGRDQGGGWTMGRRSLKGTLTELPCSSAPSRTVDACGR